MNIRRVLIIIVFGVIFAAISFFITNFATNVGNNNEALSNFFIIVVPIALAFLVENKIYRRKS
ncbi:hypothetical protein [Erwinia sp. ErVv1]|uniref:hypothetical protein n=1 Tax=Erwinia sp. ErVv1 TaxID=1603299 RepID=UPI000830BC56|nr:hypothetical protein [Erwinia sp. ErVv1]